MVFVRKMTEAIRLRNWMIYIKDIAYDRDGYHNAKDLGELVDELRGYAVDALAGKEPPHEFVKGD
jgi:hypothetical protein